MGIRNNNINNNNNNLPLNFGDKVSIDTPVKKFFISKSIFGNRLYLGVNYKPIVDGSDYGIRSYSKVIGWILSKLRFAKEIDFGGKGNTRYVNMNSLAKWEFRKISSFLDSEHLSSADNKNDEAIVLARDTYNEYKKKGYDPKILEAIKNQFNNKVLKIETINEFNDSMSKIIKICTNLDDLSAPHIRKWVDDYAKGEVYTIVSSTNNYIDQVQMELQRSLNKNERILVFKHLSLVLIKNSDDDKTKKLLEDYSENLIKNWLET